MTIDRGDYDAIVQADFEELVSGQVPEGLRLEYKREIYGASDSEKRELLKDVTALANSHGGHLLLGIEESGGVATMITGIECSDPDAVVLRMEQIIRSGIEPKISGIRIRAIPVETDQYIFALRIPRSWRPPHRVIANGSNRFYIRHSAGVHEASVEELRVLFTQSSSALDNARRFRDERIDIIRKGDGPRPLVANGRLFIHIVPAASPSGIVSLDIEEAYSKHDSFRPLGANSMSPCYNYYGFINERRGEYNFGYTQIFRDGCLEATKGGIVNENSGRKGIGGIGLEQHIFTVLSHYINGLRDIGVPPPLIIMFTLEDVNGAHYYVHSNHFGEYDPPLPHDILRLPEMVLEDYGDDADYHRAVRPAFDALWNSIGYSRAQSFNDDGVWAGLGSR